MHKCRKAQVVSYTTTSPCTYILMTLKGTRFRMPSRKKMGSLDSEFGFVESRELLKFSFRRYPSFLKTMIPLPDPEAPANSPSHPNAYPVFGARSTVMALYPDTSCFYRAEVTEVVTAPREGRVSTRANSNFTAYMISRTCLGSNTRSASRTTMTRFILCPLSG